MLSWFAWIPVLGIVIFVHELGHFLAAKWAGVYAPRFSLGWGKPLWSFRRGETEYALSMLPIGGYVRMASQEDETASVLEGGSEGDIAPEARSKHWDEHSMIPHGPLPIPPDRWFESKPLYKRLVILLAGVFMNVVLTLVVSTGVFAWYGRGYLPPVVDTVVAGKPAAAAGMLRGDSVVAVDGAPVARWDEVHALISAAPERELTLDVVRSGERISLRVTPEAQMIAAPPTGEATRVGRIGVGAPNRPIRESIALPEAAVMGWNATWEMGGSVIQVLGGLFRGSVSISQLGGPIEIARSSVEAARTGSDTFWGMIAFLSINLAVLNLLPIPLMDGGQILLQVAESAWRRPLPVMVKEWYARIGLVAILALFLTVTFNDLRRLITGWFGA